MASSSRRCTWSLRSPQAKLAAFASAKFALLTWSIAHPSVQILPLPAALISLHAEEGRALRDRAQDRADLETLESHFETQKYASYCGVASSVIALNALGRPVSQETFFDKNASAVRGDWATFYMGMTVDQLGDLLVAHGANVEVVHAGETTVDEFRSVARENLSRTGDVSLLLGTRVWASQLIRTRGLAQTEAAGRKDAGSGRRTARTQTDSALRVLRESENTHQ